MKIILSFPTFHKLVTSWIRQFPCTSLVIFVTSLTFTIRSSVRGCAATCDAIWKTKVYYNKVFWFSEASQMAEQTTAYTDKDIFHMIVWYHVWVLLPFRSNGTIKKGIKKCKCFYESKF